jgi:hypothetical protein
VAEIRLKCFSCGTELSFIDSVSRRDECSKCGADVRVCKNCRFYDPKVYNECRETQADPIQVKDRSNMCDFFQAGSAAGGDKSREAMLKAAEALFKKK